MNIHLIPWIIFIIKVNNLKSKYLLHVYRAFKLFCCCLITSFQWYLTCGQISSRLNEYFRNYMDVPISIVPNSIALPPTPRPQKRVCPIAVGGWNFSLISKVWWNFKPFQWIFSKLYSFLHLYCFKFNSPPPRHVPSSPSNIIGASIVVWSESFHQYLRFCQI